LPDFEYVPDDELS
jgi:lipase ATG15